MILLSTERETQWGWQSFGWVIYQTKNSHCLNQYAKIRERGDIFNKYGNFVCFIINIYKSIQQAQLHQTQTSNSIYKKNSSEEVTKSWTSRLSLLSQIFV